MSLLNTEKWKTKGEKKNMTKPLKLLNDIKLIYGNEPYSIEINNNNDWKCPYNIIPIDDSTYSLYKSLLTLTSEEYNLCSLSEKPDMVFNFIDQLTKFVYSLKLTPNQISVLCHSIKNTVNNSVVYHCCNYLKKNIIVLSEISVDDLNMRFKNMETGMGNGMGIGIEQNFNSICYMPENNTGNLILFRYPSGIYNPMVFKNDEEVIYAEQIMNSSQLVVNEYQIDLFKVQKK